MRTPQESVNTVMSNVTKHATAWAPAIVQSVRMLKMDRFAWKLVQNENTMLDKYARNAMKTAWVAVPVRLTQSDSLDAIHVIRLLFMKVITL